MACDFGDGLKNICNGKNAMSRTRRLLPFAIGLAVFLIAALVLWQMRQKPGVPEGFVATNGRLEATEIDIATKLSGRIDSVLVDEGDFVKKDRLLARMDRRVLEAQIHQAAAEVARAIESKNVAIAVVRQRESECSYAKKEYQRASTLFKKGHVSEERLDHSRTELETTQASCAAAGAQRVEADAAIEATQAQVQRLYADLVDMDLIAPRAGQVLYRLAEPGEVLASGGKVLTMIDLDEIYMNVYLPTQDAGKVIIGSEARILLDALPTQPFPAVVSFIAQKAQFTPKLVETTAERQKLMFRVKIKALKDPSHVLKPGMPGIVYLRKNDAGPWPDELK